MCFFRRNKYKEERGQVLFSEYNELLYYVKIGDVVNIDGRDLMFWKHDPPKYEYDSCIQIHIWNHAVFYFTNKDGQVFDYGCTWLLKKIQAKRFYETQQKLNAKRK